MHKDGHVGMSLLLFSPVSYWLLTHKLTFLFAISSVAMVFWGIFPDIDTGLPIRHRGPTHSVACALLAGIATAIGFAYISPQIFGLALLMGAFVGVYGVLSHLVADIITPTGLRPLWPFSNRRIVLGNTLAADEQANRYLLEAGSLAFGGLAVAAYL